MPWNIPDNRPVKPKSPKNEGLDQAYRTWQQKQTPMALREAVEAASPILRSAVTSYGGGDQALLPRARVLAAKALQTYDPNRGASLHSHLMVQLQPLLRTAKQRQSAIRVPERITTDLYRLRQFEEEYRNAKGRDPDDIEAASGTGLSRLRLQRIRKYSSRETAESQMVGSNEEGESELLQPTSDPKDPKALVLEYLWHDSDPIDRKIMEWRGGYNGSPILDVRKVAANLGISPSAVSQRASRLHQRLADNMDLGE